MADVIAHVAGKPVSRVTLAVIQRHMRKFFGQEEYESFSEIRVIEWAKKVEQMSLRAGYFFPIAMNLFCFFAAIPKCIPVNFSMELSQFSSIQIPTHKTTFKSEFCTAVVERCYLIPC